MLALNGTEDVAKNEAVLRIDPRSCRCHADRSENLQARKLVLPVHIALRDADVGPCERRACSRIALGANESDPGFVQSGASHGAGVGQREDNELSAARTAEPGKVSHR